MPWAYAPLLATVIAGSNGARAAPIVRSLSPLAYRCAVSMKSTPASTAPTRKARFSGVSVSRLVPSPTRLWGLEPTVITSAR